MVPVTLKARIRAREQLIGTFVKTGSHQIVEILGGAGFDFLVIDAEHAPFDRHSLDLLALAARASNVPALVRVPDTSAQEALAALDMGFAGILSPHAKTPESAQQIVAHCRYVGGARGFSNSPRAGGYGAIGMREHIDRGDANSVVVCQIEDREALDNLDGLLAVEGVDCYLIGRADLAVSLGCVDVGDAKVAAAVTRIITACVTANKAVGMFVGDARDVPAYAAQGVSMFIAGSDQSMLRGQAISVVRNAKGAAIS